MKVSFQNYECEAEFHVYGNGRTAIQLRDSDGVPVATATVNLPEAEVPAGHVLIKNWSENRGMVQALAAAGICVDTGLRIETGYVQAHVCKLLI